MTNASALSEKKAPLKVALDSLIFIKVMLDKFWSHYVAKRFGIRINLSFLIRMYTLIISM